MGGAPSKILGDSLVQGGEDVLSDGQWFQKANIKTVVGICHRTVDHEAAKIDPKDVFWVNKNDMPSVNLAPHFEQTTEHIHRARAEKGHNVYVHCSAGISRSSTVTLAYLMCFHGIEFDSALHIARAARPAVSPNNGFRQQLEEWQKSEKRSQLQKKLLETYHAGAKDVKETDLFKDDIEKCLEHLRGSAEQKLKAIKFIDGSEILVDSGGASSSSSEK
mmetsp:Transcript_3996/g.5987  ORF Transcript_3996/g.5987 Transcript_3996/m.5987 type:complete len:219 (-) Transcript_3996:28-684(-)